MELWSRWQLFLGLIALEWRCLICYFYFAIIINAFTALQMCHLGSKPTLPILEEARFLPTRSPSLLRSPRNTSPGVKSSDETAGNNHTAKKHAVLSKIWFPPQPYHWYVPLQALLSTMIAAFAVLHLDWGRGRLNFPLGVHMLC